MSTLIHEQRDDRLVLRRLRRMQRLRRRRRRRTDEMLKRALEILGWLTAVLIFLYAGHAAFAQTAAGGEEAGTEAARVELPRLTREEEAAEEAERRANSSGARLRLLSAEPLLDSE
jgi:hypothetical protein